MILEFQKYPSSAYIHWPGYKKGDRAGGRSRLIQRVWSRGLEKVSLWSEGSENKTIFPSEGFSDLSMLFSEIRGFLICPGADLIRHLVLLILLAGVAIP